MALTIFWKEAMKDNSTIKPEKSGKILVYSCGLDFPKEAVFPDLYENLQRADAVFASKNLLKAAPFPLSCTHPIDAKAKEQARLALHLSQEGKNIVVLCSGDALYHGFGASLSALKNETQNEKDKEEKIIFYPNITIFQSLMHRLGLPWQDCAFFSVHAGKDLPLYAIKKAPFALIYCGKNCPADKVATLLSSSTALHSLQNEDFIDNRPALIAERLATKDEKILAAPLHKIASSFEEKYAAEPCHPTSILLILPHKYANYLKPFGYSQAEEHPKEYAGPILPLGLDNEHYQYDIISSPDVRALALARLRLPAWGRLWDLGAGSGSIGLEAAALCPHLQVIAVEKNPKRCKDIASNQKSLGLVNHSVHLAEILDFLANTQEASPQRIILGGGGKDLSAIVQASMKRLAPAGLLLVIAVSLESFATLLDTLPEHRKNLSSVNIAHEQGLAKQYRHLKPQNSVYFFTFSKEPQT